MAPGGQRRRAFAPGRVNLIGEHTDYTGGLVLPVALELGITVEVTLGGAGVAAASDGHEPAELPVLTPETDLATIEPSWLRFLVAAARRVGVVGGFTAAVTSDLPVGGTGLSSSSALTCATVLAMGGEGTVMELAQLARLAEIDATGVEIGIMDQAASLGGVADHALLIDCRSLEITLVPVPASLEVLVVHTGQPRDLAGSAYRRRLEECRRIEQLIGPLRDADDGALGEVGDPILVRRARHVITENQRVRRMVDAFAAGDGAAAGAVLVEGHRSLSADYEVSTPIIDQLVADVAAMPGVHGARLTGGGFGGSLVALCEPGTTVALDTWWTRARPGAGARVLD